MNRLIIALLTGWVGMVSAQNAPPVPASGTDASRELVADGIGGVIAAGTKVHFIQGGLRGSEGVISMLDGTPLFCEPDNNRIYKITDDNQLVPFLEDTNRTIGLAYDHKGRLISTQSFQPRLGILSPNREVLVDSFDGRPLVRPNDLVVDKKNGIYFSDPLPGNPKQAFREPPPGRKGLMLYRRPDGAVIKVAEAVTEPHKITLSPDERTFYAGDRDRVLAFDVKSDGTVVNPRTFAEVHGEALTVDESGRLYVSLDEGIDVFSPQGKLLGTIPTAVHIQNFAFTGKDRRTLIAVGKGNVYRIAMLSRGLRSRQK